MKMTKGSVTVTIEMDYLRFHDSMTGLKWEEPTRHNDKSFAEIVNAHIRSLKLRGYE